MEETANAATLLIAALIYSLVLLFFSIAFFVIWLKRRQQLQSYYPYGLFIGSIFVGLEILILLSTYNKLASLPFPFFFILIVDTINFFKLTVFTIVGIDYACALEYISFPILSGMRSDTNILGKFGSPTFSKFLLQTIAVALFSLLYTILLFKVTHPEIGSLIEQFTDNSLSSTNLSIASFLSVTSFALVEEIIFRLGIQNFLAKHLNWQQDRYWIAIAVTSIFWTLGHAGSLNPDWIKFMQIFPMGLLLGWLFRKQGIESCILAHGLFNILLIPLSADLIK
jgi:membrane protease YdiL (CAAX protease family)